MATLEQIQQRIMKLQARQGRIDHRGASSVT